MEKIYNKVWRTVENWGNEDIFLNTTSNPSDKIFDLEGKIFFINNAQCNFGPLKNERYSKFSFEMNLSFEKGELLNLIKNSKDKDTNDIEILQEIWLPLSNTKNIDNEFKFNKNYFPFATCIASGKINKNNFDKFIMNCHISISDNKILKGEINVNSFFDKVYIKQNNKTNIISLYFKMNKIDNGIKILTLSDNSKNIICPNQPLFLITSKDYITMGDYYHDTNKYSFFIVGILTNGYNINNESLIKLNETNDDIKFSLKIEDNLMNSGDNELNVSCSIPRGSRYNMRNFVTIKCIGEKKNFSINNKNVDILLNWGLKENNIFNNIIISWPSTYDKSTQKNIFGYQLTGLSIRQSNFVCHEKNFDFFVYIYNINSQPLLSFNLPLSLPKNSLAKCEIFDSKALKCSLNLKHKKLSKGDKVMLPTLGSEYDIFNNDGNRIIFKMNNYSTIKNDHDFYVTLKESCGDNAMIGTLKDMGLSHEDSTIIYIFVILGVVVVVVGFIIDFYCKIKKRVKKGMKLTTNEESKENQGNITTGIKA